MTEIGESLRHLIDDAIELGLESAHFDDIVHEVASQKASLINNRGIQGQIFLLWNELGRYETTKIVEGLTK